MSIDQRDSELLQRQQRKWQASRYFQKGNRPAPHNEANTSYVDAGPLRIGVEGRTLDTDAVAAHLDSLGIAQNSGYGATTRGRTFEDGGPSVRVFGSADGVEYLRFDCFRDDPHYHYIVPGLDGVVKMAYDPVANGEVSGWVISRLRTCLPAMLENAGAGHLAEQVGRADLSDAIDQLERVLSLKIAESNEAERAASAMTAGR